MKDFRVEAASAIGDHQVRIRWNDGMEGVVDFSDLIRPGTAFEPLRDPALFAQVRLYEFGHTIYWLAPDGTEIDICPDILRSKTDPEVAEWIAEQEHEWRARPAAE